MRWLTLTLTLALTLTRYAFVSYETVEMANNAIAHLHNMTVEGRALRVELARADKEAKPY